MTFSDYLIYSESKEQVEGSLDRWRYALVRRREVRWNMCVKERETDGKVNGQEAETRRLDVLKYPGSAI